MSRLMMAARQVVWNAVSQRLEDVQQQTRASAYSAIAGQDRHTADARPSPRVHRVTGRLGATLGGRRVQHALQA